jgi:hypothetical protein
MRRPVGYVAGDGSAAGDILALGHRPDAAPRLRRVRTVKFAFRNQDLVSPWLLQASFNWG